MTSHLREGIERQIKRETLDLRRETVHGKRLKILDRIDALVQMRDEHCGSVALVRPHRPTEDRHQRRLWDSIPTHARISSRYDGLDEYRCKAAVSAGGKWTRCRRDGLAPYGLCRHHCAVFGVESSVELEARFRQIELDRKRNPLRLRPEDCHARTDGVCGSVSSERDDFYSEQTAVVRHTMADNRPYQLLHRRRNRRYEGFSLALRRA